jgi:5'-nucleotidase/UDP-sugar diphosphatase
MNPSPARRTNLAGSLTSLPLTGACDRWPEAAEQDRSQTISIFHTTDLHGHITPIEKHEGLRDFGGLARCASCIRQWRKQSPHSLTVDVGDLYQGTPASLATNGRLMVELLNRIGYDAWTLGNHDFDWGPEVLETHLAASNAAVLTGNLSRSGKQAGRFDGVWGKVRPWAMHDVGGFRIALIGLITPGLPYWLTPETLGGTEVTDPAASLANSVREARGEGANAVVVTGHMGWRFADDYANPVRELLNAAEGVDVYLAGHSHQHRSMWMQGNTLCSQASSYGMYCGRVDLTFDTASRELVGRRACTVLMDDRFEADPLVMQVANPVLATTEQELTRTICTVTSAIKGRKRGSPLVVLLCQAFAAALAKQQRPVDGIFHGNFDTKAIATGSLTVGDCWKILPDENLLATAELTGRQLVEIVREDRKDRFSNRTLWPFELTFDQQGAPTRFTLAGEPVDLDRRYTIGFNSYDGQSGGRRLMTFRAYVAAPSAKRHTTSVSCREALIDYCLDTGAIGSSTNWARPPVIVKVPRSPGPAR